MSPAPAPPLARWTHACRRINAGIIVVCAVFFFLAPAAITIRELSDPNLRANAIPHYAWALHRDLSPRYAKWAANRLASQRAAQLTTRDISGTEWPLFGSVFYLWSTESLQQAWDKDHSLSPVAPNVYARDAIEAATSLVIDPTQANWVKIHWGTNYLKSENIFYRMLVIAALTSHANLTGEKQNLPLLKDQVDSLAAELDASPHGLLDDYPGQCYPGDVLTTIAMIHKADHVLGTDHSAFVTRALRGFQDHALDPRGLVPYFSSATSGRPLASTRGCDNSYVSLTAPDIWPEQAQTWYDLHAKYFWQERATCAGFREFPNDIAGNDWYIDVDSGPVWAGFGCAASAFGVGAARVNGHYEHAWPLSAEMIATSWPLPNGTRLLPRMLSNAVDAPYIGDASILYNLTRTTSSGMPVKTGGKLPNFVLIFVALQISAGLVLLASALFALRRWQKRRGSLTVTNPRFQVGFWLVLMIAAGFCLVSGKPAIAIVLMLFANLLPRWKRLPPAR